MFGENRPRHSVIRAYPGCAVRGRHGSQLLPVGGERSDGFAAGASVAIQPHERLAAEVASLPVRSGVFTNTRARKSPDHRGARIGVVKDCLICERVALARDAQYAYLIAEMEHSYFVVGDHQFHEGQELVRRRGVTLTVLPPRFPCAQTGNTGHYCFKTPVPAQSRPTLPRLSIGAAGATIPFRRHARTKGEREERMPRLNFLNDEPWDEVHDDLRFRARWFGHPLGADMLGASLRELLPGSSGGRLHAGGWG